MKFIKSAYILAGLAAMFSFASCEESGDGPAAKVELTATISQIPEGVVAFDQENGILTVDKSGVMTSAISFADANGNDLNDFKLKTDIPAADKIWCVASCSKTRLSLSIAKNTTANPRQTTIDITAYQNDEQVNTYTLTVMQKGEDGSGENPTPNPGTGAEITQFIIPGQISSEIKYPTITITMPQGTDVTALKPVVVVSEGSTVTPASGVAQDFTEAVQYHVINEKTMDSKTYFAVVTIKTDGGGGTDPGTGGETNPNFTSFDMVTIGAGSFILGKQPSEYFKTTVNAKDQENAHKVNLSAFEMGRYEVTQREFLQVMGYNPSRDKSNDLYPVSKVTLYEAMNYCNKLSEQKGYTPVYTFSDTKWDKETGKELLEATVTRNKEADGYRLPTNAEFEYAMKGGPENEKYPFYLAGSDDIDEVCWYADNSIIGDTPHVHVVGLKKPNALGIYDLSGNIEEMTGEWYMTLDYASDAEETDPWGPEKPRDMAEQLVITRGGCYTTYRANCAVQNWRIQNANCKTNDSPGSGSVVYDIMGFRIVRSIK